MVLHFCLSASGPLQAADTPQDNSLKSMWPSWFSSNAANNGSTKIVGRGGETRGRMTSMSIWKRTQQNFYNEILNKGHVEAL